MLALSNDPVWFCLRAEPKREHLAATALRRRFGIECLSPRLRFRKLTQRGPVWFVEAMFPGYLFAKFVYSTQYRAVESSHGVRGILRFGERLATLPEDTVIALQSKAGAEEVVTVDSSPKIGQPVQLIEGPFQGLESGGHPVIARKRTDPSVARVSWAVAGDGTSCGKSAPNLTGDPVQTKWPSRGTATLLPASRGPGRFTGNSSR